MRIIAVCEVIKEGKARLIGVVSAEGELVLPMFGVGGRSGRLIVWGALRQIGKELSLVVSHTSPTGLSGKAIVFGRFTQNKIEGTNLRIEGGSTKDGEFYGTLVGVAKGELVLVDESIGSVESLTADSQEVHAPSATSKAENEIRILSKPPTEPFPVDNNRVPGLSVNSTDLVQDRKLDGTEDGSAGRLVF